MLISAVDQLFIKRKKKGRNTVVQASGALPERKTILLVDDEEMVIEVGEKMLRTIGYNVLLARSGQEALDILSKVHGEKGAEGEGEPGRRTSKIPDLVILDIVMPEMGGSETYDRLKEIDPDLKVLLASGYSLEDQALEMLERGCSGFIQKPFNLQQLVHKIREVMEQ